MNKFRVSKVDSDRNLVFGWAYVSITKDGKQVVDHSSEFVDPVDLEDAAYIFNLDFRKSGEMHEGDAVGELIESFMVTPEKLELWCWRRTPSLRDYGWDFTLPTMRYLPR